MAQSDLSVASPATITCDADLIERVRAQLSRVFKDTFNIDIRARDGVVTLVGQIRDSAQSRAASLVTHRVDGVTNVVNKLTIGRGSLLAVPPLPAPRRNAARRPRNGKSEKAPEAASPPTA